jgi:D-alanyl-D-alanine carboxypeptidase
MTLDVPFAIARHADPIEGESRFRVPWWSITKTVLAAATLRLVDQGALELDELFGEWPFTIRQLLQHTSGLNTYGGAVYQQAVANGDTPWSVDELLQRRNAKCLLFRPGEGWAYSNIGYMFVRQLIEHTTGAKLDSALRRLVFGPMQIENTRLAETPRDMTEILWGNPKNYDPRWVYHGLLIGPPTDAVEFLRRLLANDFLSKASRSAMQAIHRLGGPLPNRPWLETGYGLGLMIGVMRGAGCAIGHSGAGHDTVSALYYFPDLPGTPTVATFAQGTNEGIVEREAVLRTQKQ